jgi:hypothetical protein
MSDLDANTNPPPGSASPSPTELSGVPHRRRNGRSWKSRVLLLALGVLILAAGWAYWRWRSERLIRLPSENMAWILSVTDGKVRKHPSWQLPALFQFTNRMGWTAITSPYRNFPVPPDESVMLVQVQPVETAYSAQAQATMSSTILPALWNPTSRPAVPSPHQMGPSHPTALVHDPDGYWTGEFRNMGFEMDMEGNFFQFRFDPPPDHVRRVRLAVFGPPTDPSSPGRAQKKPILWSMTVKSPRWKWGSSRKPPQPVPAFPQTAVGQNTSATLLEAQYLVAGSNGMPTAEPWSPPGETEGYDSLPVLSFQYRAAAIPPHSADSPIVAYTTVGNTKEYMLSTRPPGMSVESPIPVTIPNWPVHGVTENLRMFVAHLSQKPLDQFVSSHTVSLTGYPLPSPPYGPSHPVTQEAGRLKAGTDLVSFDLFRIPMMMSMARYHVAMDDSASGKFYVHTSATLILPTSSAERSLNWDRHWQHGPGNRRSLVLALQSVDLRPEFPDTTATLIHEIRLLPVDTFNFSLPTPSLK